MQNDATRRPARQRPLTTPDGGRRRAQRWFALGPVCAECEVAPATERHHWDGNPHNNDRNVVALCRRCHMRIDGRLDAIQKQGHRDKTQPAKPCAECGRLYKPLRRGLCSRCYDRKHPR